MENNQFEDSFRSAFAGAEVSPSNGVWTNIELDLEKASGGKMKRNLLMFPLLGAASVAFAFGVTALYYLDQSVAQNAFPRETLSKESALPLPNSAKKSAASIEGKEKSMIQKAMNLTSDSGANAIADQSLQDHSEKPSIEYKITRSDLSTYVKTKRPTLILPKGEEQIEPDAGMVMLARLKDEEKKYRDEEKKKSGSNEKIWASVGFGAGSYKPNKQSSSASLYGLNTKASPVSTTGESYSVGVSVAGKISKRFILQGGISYLTQNADFTSTTSSYGAAMLDEFKPNNFSAIGGVGPYQVNSSSHFVSIPVQAGYLIIDRAFGLQLNGGVSTDLFVSNTLSPAEDSYQKVTQSAGKDSPYRTINFSGLLGTEFSYRIRDQYRISVNPGLRYSLNSIYKEEVAAEITPVTVDVSLRFRYIFK